MKRLGLATAFLIVLVAGYLLVLPRWGVHVPSPEPNLVTPAAGSSRSGIPASGRKSGSVPAAPLVVTAEARTQDVPIAKTVVGTMEPIDTVVIRPQTDGVVIAKPVMDGQMVKAGDVLFSLDDRAIRAVIAKDQAALSKDQANLDSASLDLAAARDLAKRRFDTKQKEYQAQAVVGALNASIAMDNAQIDADEVELSHMTINAPIDGRVGLVNTSVGDLVRAADTGNGLLTITRMKPLRVSFTVAERDLPGLRAAMADHRTRVRVTLPGNSDTIATGTLEFIDSSVDTASGTVLVKAEVANEDGVLWPGQYVTAVVELGSRKNATTVPLVAVQQGDQGAFVFVVRPDRTITRQAVTVADTVGESAVIASGLSAGDHVVVDGQLHLQDRTAVQEIVTASDAQRDALSFAGAADGPSAPIGVPR